MLKIFIVIATFAGITSVSGESKLTPFLDRKYTLTIGDESTTVMLTKTDDKYTLSTKTFKEGEQVDSFPMTFKIGEPFDWTLDGHQYKVTCSEDGPKLIADMEGNGNGRKVKMTTEFSDKTVTKNLIRTTKTVYKEQK